MADPMKIRANVVGDSTEVKVLMSHEMETGQRKDAQGKIDPGVVHPERRPRRATARPVLSAQWGPAVAKNPFLSFKFKGGAKGDKVADHLDRQPRRQAHRRSDDRLSDATRTHQSGPRDESRRSHWTAVAGARAAARSPPAAALAQGNDAADEIDEVPRGAADGNPAELWEARGEDAVEAEARARRRCRSKHCDLGLGPGVVKGAYAQLPRYFADTDRVQDLESRLV